MIHYYCYLKKHEDLNNILNVSINYKCLYKNYSI